jgi:hypothetical protein
MMAARVSASSSRGANPASRHSSPTRNRIGLFKSPPDASNAIQQDHEILLADNHKRITDEEEDHEHPLHRV